MNNLYIFVHIPKTAGETFKRNIEASLPKGAFLRTSFTYFEPYYDMREKRKKFYEGRESFTAYLNSLTEEQKEKIVCLGGHDSYYGIHEHFTREPKYFAFLREPVARTLSLYNYERMAWEIYSQKKGELDLLQRNFLKRMQENFLINGEVPSFEEWLSEIYDQKIPFYYSMTRYLKTLGFNGLDPFYFIGLTENYDEDAQYLYRELGVTKGAVDSNASKPYVTLDKLDKRVIERIKEVNREDISLYEEAKKRRLKKTDERFVPWSNDFCTGCEHLHRYAFAQKFAPGKKVLDLACGEGYGSAMLANSAEQVVGVDISEEAIAHARVRYKRANLSFMTGDMTRVPMTESFDMVVCFEALEYVADHERLLKEVKRLMKPDGIFIVSTPNKPVYSENGTRQNPFHLKELDFDDFEKLMKWHFHNFLAYGQKTYASSKIFPLSRPSAGVVEYTVKKEPHGYEFVHVEDPLPRYFIAVASEAKIDCPEEVSYLSDITRRQGYVKWEVPKKKSFWKKLKAICVSHFL